MKYLSTRNNKLNFSFFEILFQGLSKDGGLFLPHEWPSIDTVSYTHLTLPTKDSV